MIATPMLCSVMQPGHYGNVSNAGLRLSSNTTNESPGAARANKEGNMKTPKDYYPTYRGTEFQHNSATARLTSGQKEKRIMKTYHVGLLKDYQNPKRLIIQCRENIDLLSCELWKYLGERTVTKAQYKRGAAFLLKHKRRL